MKYRKKAFFPVLLVIAMIFSFAGCTSAAAGGEPSAQPSPSATVSPEPQRKSYEGQLEALDKTEIIPDAMGKILQSPFAVGDAVQKGDLLYVLDDNGLTDSIATAKISVEKAELSLKTANNSLADLKVYAPCGGILEDFDLRAGERVNATTLGEIVNEDQIIATVPFNAQQAAQIKVGDRATLSSSLHMAELSGTVTLVYDQTEARQDGSVLRNVEIRADNPGGFVSGSSVGAQVETPDGAVSSALPGMAVCGEATPLVSRASGYAGTIYAKSGQRVDKDQLILEIENDNLTATAKRAALERESLLIKLRSLQQNLASCTIYSPMTGVVTEVKKSAPNSITSDSSGIMTVSDISKLVLKIEVSEDDLNRFGEGTSVTLKTDSAQYPELTAAVTEVSPTGRSDNGVLVYPVTITADNPDSLMPGTRATVVLP